MTLLKQNYKYSLGLIGIALLVLVMYPGSIGIPRLAYFTTVVFFICSIFLPKIWNSSKGNLLLYMLISFLGISSALITPVLNTPDEPVHFARALKVSTGEFNLDNNPKHLTVSKDYQIVNNQAKSKITRTTIFAVPSSNEQISFKNQADYRATNQYSFVSYLPQAFGILVGKVLHLNVGFIYYLGRTLNAIVYALLAVIAVKLSGRFKQLMFLGATFPMSISLAGSYNQDASALGFQLIAIGFFVYLLEKEEKISGRNVLYYFLICILVMLSKVPFVALAGLIIFIPKKKFKNTLIYVSSFILVSFLVLLTAFWYKISQQVGYHFNLTNTSLSGQVHKLISEPNIYIPVIFKEFFNLGDRTRQLFVFGWLDLPMDRLYPYFMSIYAYIIFLNSGIIRLSRRVKFGIIAVCSVIVLGVVAVMYLTWTPVGGNEVLGIQGRYFISIYVLLLLLVTSVKPKRFTIIGSPDTMVLQTSLYSTLAMLLLSISMMS